MEMTEYMYLVKELSCELLAHGLVCATAESCTGGLAGAMLTSVPGSSAWYVGGVISYANHVKTDLLGVDNHILESMGAVSEPVVKAMAQGVCSITGADAALALSGVAGPDGGSLEKPVGTVWIGWCFKGETRAQCCCFLGSRDRVREQAAATAIQGLTAWLKEKEKAGIKSPSDF
jgi:nicotinamide-nucleotide amidase